VVGTRFARVPVYEKSLDDIFGVAFAQDLLHIADQDLPRRKVRELTHPINVHSGDQAGLGVVARDAPEKSPYGHRHDEHGLVADWPPSKIWLRKLLARVDATASSLRRDVVREPDGGLVMRGSMSIDNVEDCLASTLATKRTKQ